ncbi:hypothetical protein BD413DRAFT_590580 [Trametes elegans]|nr:hypothetical protein BD413DRAFT_590580 [Trametes elegans]
MLRQEARAYASFPREFMQDTVAAEGDCDGAGGAGAEGSGADGVAESDQREDEEVGKVPEPVGECAASQGASSQKADETDSSGRNDASTAQPESAAGKTCAPPARLVTIPAVVPKFYGYYAPAKADGTPEDYSHAEHGCGLDSECRVAWWTSILLVEECGSDIDPYNHSRAERMACLELIERLHAAGYTHNSTYVRNMLVQPGPLSAPRGERSMDCPSFRIIDFGRCKASARGRDDWVFKMEKLHDRRHAERDLRL